MKIKSLNVQEFRRFHDLRIIDIPQTTKLVVIAGPNGNGKSSLFDLMMKYWERVSGHGGHSDPTYYGRVGSTTAAQAFRHGHIEFHGTVPANSTAWRKSFYFRSAYRNEPEMRNEPLQRLGPAVDERRFQRLIDNDAAVASNYKRLVSQGLEDAFEIEHPSTTIGMFRENSIGNIRDAVMKVFPELQLNGLGNPMNIGEFRFTKGSQAGYSYKNLSGGEKAAFDLLLDIAIKTREFDDTVFCIDEPEAHLNPKVHGKLLHALLSLIGDSSQLWIATHSIGMMRAARDIEKSSPGAVCLLDFDKNFDQTQVISPENMTRSFWQKILSTALDDVADLVAPAQVIACESWSISQSAQTGHDAAIYNRIFNTMRPEVSFVSLGSRNDLVGDRFAVLQVAMGLTPGVKLSRLRDRDGMSDREISAAQADGIRVLSVRNLEGYIFDDEVLRNLCISVNQPESIDALLDAKRQDMQSAEANGHPADDLKKAAGRISNSCRRILKLVNAGSTTNAFMFDTLAPLIIPGTQVYANLERDIF